MVHPSEKCQPLGTAYPVRRRVGARHFLVWCHVLPSGDEGIPRVDSSPGKGFAELPADALQGVGGMVFPVVDAAPALAGVDVRQVGGYHREIDRETIVHVLALSGQFLEGDDAVRSYLWGRKQFQNACQTQCKPSAQHPLPKPLGLGELQTISICIAALNIDIFFPMGRQNTHSLQDPISFQHFPPLQRTIRCWNRSVFNCLANFKQDNMLEGNPASANRHHDHLGRGPRYLPGRKY